MAQLLKISTGFQRPKINNVQAFLYTLPLISFEILLLTIFSIVDPPQQTELLGVGEGIGVQQVTCTTKTNAFFITQVVFDGTVFRQCFELCCFRISTYVLIFPFTCFSFFLKSLLLL